MQLEVGKVYVDREGNTWDCTEKADTGIYTPYFWCVQREDDFHFPVTFLFLSDGSYINSETPFPWDLIAEYSAK